MEYAQQIHEDRSNGSRDMLAYTQTHTHRHTDRQTDRNNPLPYRGGVKIADKHIYIQELRSANQSRYDLCPVGR